MKELQTHHLRLGVFDIYVANIDPMVKPRMTQRDKWKKRPVVERYFAFRDQIRAWILEDRVEILGQGSHIIYRIQVLDRFSEIKKHSLIGRPHRGTLDRAPAMDKDNLDKGLLDAFFDDDSHIWNSESTKLWHTHGEIIIINDETIRFKPQMILEYIDAKI